MRIIADILHIASEGANKTRIMYQANLSYKLLCQYLEQVVSARLVVCENDRSYVLTSSGEQFLERLDEYHKQCEQLEEQTSCVQGERVELEQVLLNGENGLDNVGNNPKGKNLEKRMV